jgi:hypothetical protein
VRASLFCLFAYVVISGVTLYGAWGQEVVGNRRFADQLVISEPFVEDELSLPSLLHIRKPGAGGPRSTTTQIGAELKKRILSNLEASLTGAFDLLSPDRGSRTSGFENLDVGLKYQFLRNEPHEAVASIAVDWEVGGTGSRSIGRSSFGTVSGTVLGGKGFGDVPQRWLKPLAVSAVVGVDIPTAGRNEQHPDVLRWGGALQYSLLYLTAVIGDTTLWAPLSHMIPLVELDLQTALNRRVSGDTTGTVNPGVVWVAESAQIGIEAVVPVNERTGTNIGVRAFVRLSLEAVFGKSAGRPLFGGGE